MNRWCGTWRKHKIQQQLPIHSQRYVGVILIFFCLAIVCLPKKTYAQRLQILLPRPPGTLVPVIYGHIGDQGLTVFEATYPLPESVSLAPDTTTSASSSSSTTSGPKAPIGTRFTLRRDELAACTDSPRVKGMLKIMTALNGKINAVNMEYGEEWAGCAQKIQRLLSKSSYTVATQVNGDNDQLLLTATMTPSATPASQLNAETTTTVGSHTNALTQRVKLFVNNQPLVPDAQGWFVYVADQLSEQQMSLRSGNTVLWSQAVYPVPLDDKVFKTPLSSLYNERVAVFNQPALGVELVAVRPMEGKYVIDAGLGVGFGYGREIPGEERGKRYMTQVGLESQRVLGPFGVKVFGTYTYAKDSVVPWTVTGRALAFYDYSLWSGRILFRGGAGGEVFQTEIKHVSGVQTTDDVFIPEQVAAPLTLVSFQSVLFDWLLLGAHWYYTPLYVIDVGKTYPSYNVIVEWGFKVPGNWLVSVATGSETHRYPGMKRDTKLNIDSSLLSIRKGL